MQRAAQTNAARAASEESRDHQVVHHPEAVPTGRVSGVARPLGPEWQPLQPLQVGHSTRAGSDPESGPVGWICGVGYA